MERATMVEKEVFRPTAVMPKVIIHVEGGLVQAVYSTEELDVQVYDLDISIFASEAPPVKLEASGSPLKGGGYVRKAPQGLN